MVLLFQTQTLAQKEAKNWHFGNKAAIVFPYNNGGLPTAITTSNMNAFEGVASISDGAGNLLFYTDGVQVFDRLNQVMPNGNGLMGSPSATQSSIIVPWPGNSNKYYIFTTPAVATNTLRYSVVDMSVVGNGTISTPAGDVEAASKNTLALGQGGPTAEKVCAVRKANGLGYYVVSLEQPNSMGLGKLLVYDVTSSGVAFLSSLNVANLKVNDLYGYLKFSPDGSKLAMACFLSDRVNIFSFNNTNGSVSPLNLIQDSIYLDSVYGVEFSPNGKYLYTTCAANNRLRYLNQFDVSLSSDAQIKSSRTLIHSYTPAANAYYGYGALQLGPDNRIYVARGGETFLAYINNPNSLGVSCTFTNNGIPLAGKMGYMGLPNYLPNFSTPVNNCSYFLPNPTDTDCCSAGIARNIPGGPAVTSIRYTVTGGVIQGYSTNCNALPSSVSLSGTSSGQVNFTPACANLTLFNTSLQSTTSNGNMVVNYWVKFVGGDSCQYIIDVVGCPRSPLIQCDQVKFKNCICSGGNAGLNFIDIHITNSTIPVSPICGFIINKYSPTNVLQNTFFTNGLVMNATPPSVTLPGPVNVTGNPLANPNGVLNIQAYYLSSSTLNGRIEVITIHCNGDTCKRNWYPNGPKLGDFIYTDFKTKSVKSPYSKISAYSFRIAGPSSTHSDPNPYKVKYLTINIPDSNGGPEIIGISGAELFEVKERANMLKIEKSSHARYTALIQINQALNLKQNDSSGIFQLFFANGIPRNATFHFYDEEGSVLSSANSTLDTSIGVGVTQLGKSSFGLNQMMLFSGYPNPTSDNYNLNISMVEASEVEIQVTDINGKLVDKINAGKLKRGLSEIHLNLSQLSNGTYFLQAKSQQNLELSNAIKVVVIR